TIGNATGTLNLVSNAFNVNTAGALSGVTGYAQASGNFLQSGAGTFGTGSGGVSLNGSTTVTAGNFGITSGQFTQSFTSATNGVNAHSITVQNNNSSSTSAAIQGVDLTPNNATAGAGAAINTENLLNFEAGTYLAGNGNVTNAINFVGTNTTYTNYIKSPNFTLSSSGNITGAGTYNSATISGGTLSSSAVNSLGVTATAIAASANLGIDTGASGTLNLGTVNAATLNLGGSSSSAQAINIGASTTVNNAITIGSTFAGSNVLKLQSALSSLILNNTGSVGTQVNLASGKTFVLQNSSTSLNSLSADASGNLTLGMSNSASGVTGSLVFANSGNNNTVTLTTLSGTAGYSLSLPTSGPAVSQCLVTDPTTASKLTFGACNNAHPRQIILTAEYAGAVLDSASDSTCSSANIGTMTSGYSGDSSPRQNYYSWTTGQGTPECYDVVVQVPVPTDWGSWTGNPSIMAYNTAGSSSAVAVEIINSAGSNDTNYSGYQNTTGSISSSALTAAPFSALGGTGYTASTTSTTYYMTLKIRMYVSSSSATTQIGNISIPYNSTF
ncbi:MAG TPA: hypothetical protein VIH90_08575, partial [Candidatus Saccharimonadales bacterium]